MATFARLTAILAALSITSLLPAFSSAHSWNEQLSLIGSDGKFTGAYGYPRGYMARTDPGFDGFSMMWMLPQPTAGRSRIDNTDLLCHPSQRSQNQTSRYPRLSVAPGSAISMKYFENGHVSLPQNQKGKPQSAGSVYVFGTDQPKPDEKLADVLQWTADGSGGDKRGRLLSAQNFDDGRCYQINGGAISTDRQQKFPDHVPGQPTSQHEQWCESDVVLPKDTSFVKPGSTLTLYWIWQWPTLPGQDPSLPTGKDEYYTTCNDLDVEPQAPAGPISATLEQQDPQVTAVPSYASRTAIEPTPMYANGIGGAAKQANNAGAPSAAPAPAAAPSSAQQPPAAAPAAAGPASSQAAVSPLPLSAFQPAAAAPSAASSAAAPGPPAANAPSMVTITIPQNTPVFIVDGGQIKQLGAKAKRDFVGYDDSVHDHAAAHRKREFSLKVARASPSPTGVRFRYA